MVVKNKYGFYSLIEKPTIEKLEKYYEQMYYQEQKGHYEKTYSNDELSYFESRFKLNYHTVKKHLL